MGQILQCEDVEKTVAYNIKVFEKQDRVLDQYLVLVITADHPPPLSGIGYTS
jgi:hypothetical protein